MGVGQVVDQAGDFAIWAPAMPEGWTVAPRPSVVNDTWYDLGASPPGCLASALMTVADRTGLDDRAASIALVENVHAGARGSATAAHISDGFLFTTPPPFEGAYFEGYNVVVGDWRQTANGLPFSVRVAARSYPYDLLTEPTEDAPYVPVSINAALRLTCPTEEIDQAAWDALVTAVRPRVAGDPETRGDWG